MSAVGYKTLSESERPKWFQVGCSGRQELRIFLGYPMQRLSAVASVRDTTPYEWSVTVGGAVIEGKSSGVLQSKECAESALVEMLDKIKAKVLIADRNPLWWER